MQSAIRIRAVASVALMVLSITLMHPGKALAQAFPRFADDLTWWVEAARAQRARKPPPY